MSCRARRERTGKEEDCSEGQGQQGHLLLPVQKRHGSGTEVLQGKKARYQTRVKILMNLVVVLKLYSKLVKSKFAVQSSLIPSKNRQYFR